MKTECPRCRSENAQDARFCAHCGLLLDSGGPQQAGRVRHPQPAAVPSGYLPCEDAVGLYFFAESSLGGQALLGTEGLLVSVLNSGYPLCEVELELRGQDREGNELFALQRAVQLLAQGERVELEVPSYEIEAPLAQLRVRLISAEFARAE